MSDAVNHPPHYTAHPSGVECITVTEHMNFNLGNAVKYIWRAGLKSGAPVGHRSAEGGLVRQPRDRAPEKRWRMIGTRYGKIIVECDACEQVLDTDTDDFSQARSIMQREQWKVRKIGSDWMHGCPKCGVPT